MVAAVTQNLLQQQLVDLIQRSESAVAAGANFLTAQIPDVIHQLLVYRFVLSLSLFVISLIGAIVSLCILMKIYKYAVNAEEKIGNYESKSVGIFIASIALIGILCISVINVFTHTDWLEIWLAPKIFLIHYIATLYHATGH